MVDICGVISVVVVGRPVTGMIFDGGFNGIDCDVRRCRHIPGPAGFSTTIFVNISNFQPFNVKTSLGAFFVNGIEFRIGKASRCFLPYLNFMKF